MSKSYIYTKRILDFIIALILLIIISPFLGLVYLVLKISNKDSGALFLQKRVGLDGTIFSIIKFKTMNDSRDQNGNLLPDEKRITKIGNFIRTYSIDELPQLINVLKGDMAIIGPRPLLVQYLPLYNKEQARRHEVRPGITGWAQVNGRNTLKWTDKFKLDVWYVDNISLRLDCEISLKTFKNIFSHKDLSYKGEATMHYFNGFN